MIAWAVYGTSATDGGTGPNGDGWADPFVGFLVGPVALPFLVASVLAPVKHYVRGGLIGWLIGVEIGIALARDHAAGLGEQTLAGFLGFLVGAIALTLFGSSIAGRLKRKQHRSVK